MKILQVSHDFLPKHRAGAEIYTFNLCRELKRRHEVELFFTEHEPARPQYSTTRGSYEDIPFTCVINNHCQRTFEETYNNPAMDAVFEKLLDDVRPDVVHFQHLLYHSVNYAPIAKERGIATVATLHDFWPICEQEGKRIRPFFEGEEKSGGDSLKLCDEIIPSLCANCVSCWPTIAPPGRRAAYNLLRKIRSIIGWDPTSIARKLSRGRRTVQATPRPLINVESGQIETRLEYIRNAYLQIDRLIAPSPFLKKEFERHGYPAGKIILSDYGFDTALFKDFRRTSGDGVRFGFVGTITEMKGVHVLVEAFNRVDDKKVTLHLYGGEGASPQYARSLKSLVKREGVSFHGAFDPAQVAEVFGSFDVLVVPSIWYENSPLVIHEAFLSRTPVVATNLGGMADLVRDGKWGLLFKSGDAADLAEKLSRLASDPGLIANLASNVPPVKAIERDAQEISDLYALLAVR